MTRTTRSMLMLLGAGLVLGSLPDGAQATGLTGACCDEFGGCTFVVDETLCTGTFDGSPSCDPNPCPQIPTGACCPGDGSCLPGQDQFSCESASGSYQGDDTTCDPFNPCPPLLGSIHGFKFEDVNANGVYDPTTDRPFDPTLLPVQFELTGDLDGDGAIETVSIGPNATGEFWFVDLYPGTYVLREVTESLPPHVRPSTQTQATLVVGPGQELVWQAGAAMLPPDSPKTEIVRSELLFGNLITGSIHGFKFEDVDGDGDYEPPIDTPFDPTTLPVQFQLTGDLDGDGVQETVSIVPNATGEFWFVDLYPGTYTLTETPPTGTVATTPTSVTLTLQSREELVWQDGAAMLTADSPKFETNLGASLMFGNQVLAPAASLDVKPGSCPNPLNRKSRGYVPIALLGSDVFDVTSVDLSTLELSRDGHPGLLAPHEGPPGPHTTLGDVAAPFPGELCGCHEEGADGFDDLVMHFDTQDLAQALNLHPFAEGASLEVVLTGQLLDGTPFEVRDCVVLVPPGPGVCQVQSFAPTALISVWPPDADGDADGVGAFERSYPPDPTNVELTAELGRDGWFFSGWSVDGGPLIADPTITVHVQTDESRIAEAHYVDSNECGNGAALALVLLPLVALRRHWSRRR